MAEDRISKDARVSDPYVDRRSGEDRRQVYDADYGGGPQRLDHLRGELSYSQKLKKL